MDIALAIRIGMARRDIKATELANRANINGSTLSLILNKNLLLSFRYSFH